MQQSTDFTVSHSLINVKAQLHCKKIKIKKSYLYLPSSEQGLVQSHGCPNRLLVCKLNIGKPEDKKENNHSIIVKESANNGQQHAR